MSEERDVLLEKYFGGRGWKGLIVPWVPLGDVVGVLMQSFGRRRVVVLESVVKGKRWVCALHVGHKKVVVVEGKKGCDWLVVYAGRASPGCRAGIVRRVFGLRQENGVRVALREVEMFGLREARVFGEVWLNWVHGCGGSFQGEVRKELRRCRKRDVLLRRVVEEKYKNGGG